ncbi:MAG: hypothetical protein RSA93_08935 [Longicatena sp.]
MKKKMKSVVTRKGLVHEILFIGIVGVLFGLLMGKALSIAVGVNFMSLSICILLFCLLCFVLWLPMLIPSNQIIEIEQQAMKIIPSYSTGKKLKIVGYILLNDSIEPFLRCIQFKDIQEVLLSFSAHYGSYGYQRFSYTLRFTMGDESLVINLNPMQNGVFLPSGVGGIPALSNSNSNDIINMVTYFSSHGIKVNDPYKILDAMKDEHVVLYDYLVSLNKTII